jgi:hypothetical protein
MVSLGISRAGRCKWCLAAGANRVHISQDSKNFVPLEPSKPMGGYQLDEIQVRLVHENLTDI